MSAWRGRALGRRRCKRVAARVNATPEQVEIGAPRAKPGMLRSGTSSIDHLEENAAARPTIPRRP